MILYFIGAFDRHNYGDILFSLVHTKVLKDIEKSDAVIKYLSVRSTDECLDYGGVKTERLEENIQNIQDDDKFIVLGGDVLCVDWVSMIGNNSSESVFLILRIFRKILGVNFANRALRFLYSRYNLYPYVLDNLPNIYYTGVSGSRFSSLSHLKKVVLSLSKANKISVRDTNTYDTLIKADLTNVELSPDTALVMSDLFKKDKELKIDDVIRNSEITDNFNIDNYIVFQIAKNYANGYYDQIIKNLEEYLKHSGKSILFVPVGYATGHSDHIALKKIYTSLKFKKYSIGYLKSKHVLSVMSSIAFSNGYVGTSLHGAITAYSFGIKVCALFPIKVPKLSSYLYTWLEEEDYETTEINELSNSLIKLYKDDYRINNVTKLLEQKDMVFNDIKKYLY